MASLYADEDFDYPVVEELRQLGHDVLTVQEAGQRGQGDRAVLAYAISQGRTVMTHNRRHFIRLHHQTPSHCGIIVCTRDQNSAALAGRIHQAIANQPNLDNQLIRIYRPPVP
jgi:predicted nuclease of predicted toxin-antitoxin system